MSIEIWGQKRLRVRAESTFATSQSVGGYEVPFVEGSLSYTMNRDMLNPSIAQSYKFNQVEKVLGQYKAEISFSLNLCSTGTSASTGVAQLTSSTNPLGLLLKHVMGGETGATGGTITGGTASIPTASTLSAVPGQMVGWGTTGTAWRPVFSVGGTAFSLGLDCPSAPSGNAYAATTYYMAQDSNPNDSTSLQFYVQGAEADDAFTIYGAACTSFAIEVSPEGLPKLNFTFSGVAFSTYADSWPISQGTYVASTGFAYGKQGAYYAASNGSTTYTASSLSTEGSELFVSSETWEPAISMQLVTAPNTNGLAGIRYVRARSAPVIKGSMRFPFQSNTFRTHWTSTNNLSFFRVIGGTPGSTIILEAPTCQIQSWNLVDDNGLNYQEVTWEGRNDSYTDDGGSDLERSPFRIHLG